MQFDFKESFDRVRQETIKETVKRLEELGATLEDNIDRGFIDGMINEIVRATTDGAAKVLEEYHQSLMKYLSEKES